MNDEIRTLIAEINKLDAKMMKETLGSDASQRRYYSYLAQIKSKQDELRKLL